MSHLEQRRNASKYFLAACTRHPALQDYLDEVREDWFVEDNLRTLFNWVNLYTGESQVQRQSFYSWLSARYPEKDERPEEFNWAIGLMQLPLDQELGKQQFRKLKEFVKQDQLSHRLKKVEKQLSDLGSERSIEELLKGLEDFSVEDTLLGPKWSDDLDLESDYIRYLMKGQNYFFETGKELVENKIRTEFPRMDQLMGGLQPGRLVVIGARTAVGKSLTLLQWAVNVAKQGKHGLYMCLEMTRFGILDRLLANFSDTDLDAIATRTVEKRQWERILDACQNKIPGFQEYGRWTEKKNHTLTSIRRAAREAKQEGLDVLFVDYLQQIKADPLDRHLPQHIVLGNITRGLKMLSMELNICVVVAAQLNREFGKGDGEPQLYHLKDSGSIEQDADQVILLHSPSDKDPNDKPGMVRAFLRKNRHGATGNVDLWVVKKRQQIGEVAPMDLAEYQKEWDKIGT